MTILVTGVNGRIGQYVAKALLKKGFKVIGLDKSDSICADLGCSYIQANITDISELELALGECKVDSVIHLAALAHFHSSNITLEEFMKINCEGAKNVARAANKCGAKKMLFSSTVEVFGPFEGPVADEKLHPNPITNYGKSKYEAEKNLEAYLASAGIEYYVFRFTPVYLPEYTKDLDKRVLLPKGLGAFYFNDGSQKFSLCSVYNIVDAVIAFAEGKVEPGLYIVSDKDALTAKEIAIIKKQCGEAKAIIRLPYGPIYAFLRLTSWVLEKCGKAEKGLLITNFNKLVKPVCYDSSKLAQRIELKWNIENSLYRSN